ncbi:MAG TPA: sugar ABC transporter permease, partial [Mobilitalea sp.]|nr:sugar ABC transporter permease [Mobilitalea sp.]
VLSGLLIANNWQWIGYWMLIYLAGLQSIPAELYEAARIDGAGAFHRFKSVTIPMLAPAITICIVGITTGSLKVYDLLVSSTMGGPGRASTSIIYQTYATAINGRQYGYGSAMSVTLVVALLIVALIQVKGLKSREVQA